MRGSTAPQLAVMAPNIAGSAGGTSAQHRKLLQDKVRTAAAYLLDSVMTFPAVRQQRLVGKKDATCRFDAAVGRAAARSDARRHLDIPPPPAWQR
jgi:hypothetical protein